MATAILAQPSTSIDARIEAYRNAYLDEFNALTQEIQEAEGVGHIEAMGIALCIVDEVAAFAVAWNDWAWWEGNDAAIPF